MLFLLLSEARKKRAESVREITREASVEGLYNNLEKILIIP